MNVLLSLCRARKGRKKDCRALEVPTERISVNVLRGEGVCITVIALGVLAGLQELTVLVKCNHTLEGDLGYYTARAQLLIATDNNDILRLATNMIRHSTW